MGQAIPRQHPAVVLRSHFNQLRTLLAITMVAVVGLTAAVVILATNDDESASPATVVSAPAPTGDIRYDGGPEEGSAGVSTSQPRVSQDQAFPGLAQEARALQSDGLRYDGGPEEGTAGVVPARQPTVTPETEIKDEASIAAAIGQSSSHLPEDGTATGTRYDGGPEEGTALSGPRP